MDKVFALCRRTLNDSKRYDWSTYRTIEIFRIKEDAVKRCLDLRQVALDNYDDSVDYCVVPFNVL